MRGGNKLSDRAVWIGIQPLASLDWMNNENVNCDIQAHIKVVVVRYIYKLIIVVVELASLPSVSGWGPGMDLGPKNVYFGGKYLKDKNSNTHFFGLITKM